MTTLCMMLCVCMSLFADGTICDTCKVTVKAHAESITLSSEVITISDIGATYLLTASILPDNAVDKSVTWKSSNEAVCTVSATGLVTATGAGTAVVTVTTVDGGLTATCVVKVVQHVTGVTLDKSALTLKVGETELLRATVSPDNADDKSIAWTSSNEQLATVDADGNVTALKAGEAWIYATSADNPNVKASCKLTIIQPVTEVTISQTNCKLSNIGESIQLTVTVLPEDATNKTVTWSSSNTSVCVVSNGIVVATGYGTAVVIATTEDGGHMASCIVIVEVDSAIHDMQADPSGQHSTYDVMGNRVKVMTKGQLYIRDGKKFVAW